MPRRNFAEVLIGAVVLLVAAGFLAYAIAHSGRSAPAGYQLYARFDHIDGLAVGSDVRVAGVKVGSVDSATIDPKTYQAVVGLTVRDDLKLPKDSSAVITSESLLGGKYLALVPGRRRGDVAARARQSPLPRGRSTSRNSWASSSSAQATWRAVCKGKARTAGGGARGCSRR